MQIVLLLDWSLTHDPLKKKKKLELYPYMEFALSQIFICATWARFDPLAFCTEIGAPVMGADSGYGEELATYWAMVKDFQQKV